MTAIQSDDIALMVLTKGFRISQDSEEFQLVWPPTPAALTSDLERRLASHEAWPKVLRALYSMPREDLRELHCVLLSHAATTSISVAHARDRYNRPMIVAICATAPILWSSPEVEVVVARTVAFGRFVASQLARRFDGNPKEVAADLKNERLGIDLASFGGPSSADLDYWNSVIRCAREWKGIAGLAAPPLVALGGNVLLGTEHEAVRFAGTGGSAVDGFYDAKGTRIVPTSENLTRWQQPWQPKEEVHVVLPPELPETAEVPPEVERQADHLESIDKTLRSIDRSVSSLTDVATSFFRVATEYFFGKPGKRDKR